MSLPPRGFLENCTCLECVAYRAARALPRLSDKRVDNSTLTRATPLSMLVAAHRELAQALLNYPPANSAHEAYAVLLWEVDELWVHVKTTQSKRDLSAMRKEAIQVAAMAIRFALEVTDEERGRK